MTPQSRRLLESLPVTPLRDAGPASPQAPTDEHERAQSSLPPTSEMALPIAVLPTPDDLRAVRRILAQRGLPAELIFYILHEAAYHAAVRSTLRDWDPAPYDSEVNGGGNVADDDDDDDDDDIGDEADWEDEADIIYGSDDGSDDTSDIVRSEHGSDLDTHPNNHGPDSHSPDHSQLAVGLSIGARLNCVKPDGGSCAARLCMLTPPLPHGAPGETWRAKAVVWDVEGHDQGWGGERPGTFDGAFSWYEATIIRPTSSADAASDHASRTLASCWDTLNRPYCSPETARALLTSLGYTFVEAGGDSGLAWFVQRNRVARASYARYHIKWSADDAVLPPGSGPGAGFLEALRPGDVVALWMRATYPGWANFLRAASVKVLYDVY